MATSPAMLVNRYRLDAPIGEGAFASAYRATDTKLLRTVAVKILRPQHAADDAFSTRFAREAQAAAQVSHPNVVQVHDYGTDGEHMFIVMHYVSGPTLAEFMRTHERLAIPDVVEIVSQILDGLAAIHDRGIVHRDIKPQNVLLEEDLTPKLGDFGVASSSQAMTLTQTGTTIGTAAYMAPEQATGEQVGPQADLYSVGVMLYELLTGRLPFSGTSPVQVMYQHVNNEPPPPRQINGDISPALEAVIMRALAKRPGDRYPNAEAMRNALLSVDVETDRMYVVPPAGYTDQPTTISRGGAPPAAPPQQPAAQEPSRWPYALAFLAVILAVVAVLAATLGGDGSFAGLFGSDDEDDPTATVQVGSEPTEPQDAAAGTEPAPVATETATPTVEPPTATLEPPTPTVPPPTETPETPPTETPAPEPTATETPAPDPTETPPPSDVEVFLSELPANQPFGADVLPGALLEGPSVSFGRDDFVDGGAYRRPDGVLYERAAAHLYAQTTDHPSTTVTFSIDEAPDSYAVLRIIGMDDESPTTVPMRVSLNGFVIHEGPNPFGSEVWTDIAWVIGEPGVVQAGENTITIEHLASEGEFGLPPWILLTEMHIYVD